MSLIEKDSLGFYARGTASRENSPRTSVCLKIYGANIIKSPHSLIFITFSLAGSFSTFLEDTAPHVMQPNSLQICFDQERRIMRDNARGMGGGGSRGRLKQRMCEEMQMSE